MEIYMSIQGGGITDRIKNLGIRGNEIFLFPKLWVLTSDFFGVKKEE
jgi:hypothetical protein